MDNFDTSKSLRSITGKNFKNIPVVIIEPIKEMLTFKEMMEIEYMLWANRTAEEFQNKEQFDSQFVR